LQHIRLDNTAPGPGACELGQVDFIRNGRSPSERSRPGRIRIFAD
jgi:hypothetical protein